MTPTLRGYVPADREAVVALSLRAWAPVFASIEQALRGSGVFERLHPEGWRSAQRAAVEDACDAAAVTTWVAAVGPDLAGFVAVALHHDTRIGELHMLAVDPSWQRRGVGRNLTRFATDWMTAQGMTTAMVETGGDPGHAPARATYEDAGFTGLAISRYFRAL